ncbi:unnamed protein product [Caenorhabditis nigoni]
MKNFYQKAPGSFVHYERRKDIQFFIRAILAILFVLIVCGVLAFALSAIFWAVIDSWDAFHNGISSEKDSPIHNHFFKSHNSSKPSACKKRLVGFFTENESLENLELQMEKLTHAVFSFNEITWDGSVRFKSEQLKNRYLKLRNVSESVKNDVKMMVSIGGHGNSQFFTTLTANEINRRKFTDSIIGFLQDYNLDGVDISWVHAAEGHKQNFVELLKEIRTRFNSFSEKKLLLSVTIPSAGIEGWENAYDLEAQKNYVDFFNVYSMDYNGPWPNQWGTPTGPMAPLYHGIGLRKNFNVDWTMKYYVCLAMDPTKFNIILPTFVRLWRNVEEPVEPRISLAVRNAVLKNGMAEGIAVMSRTDAEEQLWDLKNNITWDDKFKSSYIYDPIDKTYLTFEDTRSVEEKVKYVNSHNLGGLWIWFVDMDDEKSSVLNSVYTDELCSRSSENVMKYNC